MMIIGTEGCIHEGHWAAHERCIGGIDSHGADHSRTRAGHIRILEDCIYCFHKTVLYALLCMML